MNEMDNNNLSQPDTNEAPAADSTKSRLKRIAGLAAAFLPALLVMLLIFWLSDQPAVQSSRQSRQLSYRIVSGFNLVFRLKWTRAKLIALSLRMENDLRIVAHFTEYFLLSLFLLLPFRLKLKKTGRNLYLPPVLISIVYAITDEIHQLTVKGRAFEIKDLVIDSLGAVCAALTTYLILRLRARKHSEITSAAR